MQDLVVSKIEVMSISHFPPQQVGYTIVGLAVRKPGELGGLPRAPVVQQECVLISPIDKTLLKRGVPYFVWRTEQPL